MTTPATAPASPLAAPATLYIGDNGRLFCSRRECAGATAYAGGHDLSGQGIDPLSPADLVQLERDTGLIPRCEGCGRDASLIVPGFPYMGWITFHALDGYTLCCSEARDGGTLCSCLGVTECKVHGARHHGNHLEDGE